MSEIWCGVRQHERRRQSNLLIIMAKEIKRPKKDAGEELPLSNINYKMMTACVVLIIIGFCLMSGSANEGTTWNPAVFDARRIVVGPLVTLAGFVLMAFAIIYRKK